MSATQATASQLDRHQLIQVLGIDQRRILRQRILLATTILQLTIQATQTTTSHPTTLMDLILVSTRIIVPLDTDPRSAVTDLAETHTSATTTTVVRAQAVALDF
jgi:hypothetical protein